MTSTRRRKARVVKILILAVDGFMKFSYSIVFVQALPVKAEPAWISLLLKHQTT
jgi:hypothetical protein